MELEKKAVRKKYNRMAVAIFCYKILFLFIVWGACLVEIMALLYFFEDVQWEQAVDIVNQGGIDLILATIISTMAAGVILGELPSMKKKKSISIKKIILFFVLIQGVQMTMNAFVLLPMELLAGQAGYSMEEATELASGMSVSISTLLYSVIFAPIMEEILCRGILMQSLLKYGKGFAVIVSAVLFGLLHQNIVQFPITLLIGIIFGYVAIEYSLKAAMVLHFLNNAFVEVFARIGEYWEWIWTVNIIFMSGCTIASIVILWWKKEYIVAFWQDGKREEPLVKWLLTTPLMLLVFLYLGFGTITSLTVL